METIPVFVGIDYHQAFVQVCVGLREGKRLGNKRIENSVDAVAEYVRPFGQVQTVTVEACCGAADFADELIAKTGWHVDLSHPGYAARMRLNKDKSDHSDAELQFELGRTGLVPKVWLAPKEVRELRLLVRTRQQLANQMRNCKLRIGAILREQRCLDAPEVRSWTKPWLAWLEHGAGLSPAARFTVALQQQQLRQLSELQLQVMVHLAHLTQDDHVVKQLLQQPGIGPVTAYTLRAEIGRFDRFHNGKQLARFCGLSPRNASSATRQADAGLIKAANPELRACLIEAAHRLGNTQPRWKALKEDLKNRGKTGSMAAAAVANRWIRSLHHQLAA